MIICGPYVTALSTAYEFEKHLHAVRSDDHAPKVNRNWDIHYTVYKILVTVYICSNQV